MIWKLKYFFNDLDHIRVNIVVKGFTRSPTWRSTLTFTQVSPEENLWSQHGFKSFPEFICIQLIFQAKSLINALFVGRLLANRRIWSHIWGNIADTNLSPVASANEDSREKWTSDVIATPNTPTRTAHNSILQFKWCQEMKKVIFADTDFAWKLFPSNLSTKA